MWVIPPPSPYCPPPLSSFSFPPSHLSDLLPRGIQVEDAEEAEEYEDKEEEGAAALQ